MLTFPKQYCPLAPTDKQKQFLELECLEIFFGGAAGGGKSVALLMGALQYVDVPGYAALILRKDTQRLALAGGLIPRSHEWLANTNARWNEARRRWTFPHKNGPPATITFGYLSSADVKFRYASSEFQYIAFDELTELPEADYLFLFSRLRRARSVAVPLRIRSASNPGNLGHDWVKRRFVDRPPGTRNAESANKPLYYPSRLADNPHLDAAEYARSLMHLPPVERELLLAGDWEIQHDAIIKPEWLRYYVELPAECGPLVPIGHESPKNVVLQHMSDRDGRTTLDLLDPAGRSLAQVHPAACRRFITVDPAGTSADRARERRGRPASHTVAQDWDQPRREQSHRLILRHQVRAQLGFDKIIELLQRLHGEWQPERIWIENEKLGHAAQDYFRHGLPIELVPTGGKDKMARAARLIVKLSRGEIFLPREETTWRPGLESELLAWTGTDNEPTDQIDAAAYAAIIADAAGPGILVMQHVVPK
jgi:phage terminase large subunit-like protein